MKIDRNFNEKEMLKEITVKEFADTGALFFINQILHLFGMAISYDAEKMDRLIPNICRFRGFDRKSIDEGCKKISNYLNDNMNELGKDYDL